MAKVSSEDGEAWVITVDMKREAVEAIAPYSTRGHKLTSWHSPCTFPKYLDPTTHTGEAILLRISVADCVLQVLLTQDWFREIDERLEIERPTLVECLSLLQCCPVSFVLSDIQEVVKYASSTGEGEAAPKAVDLCSRAFEDFDVQLRESLHDPESTAEGMRSKISVALRALDRALADACHRKGGKTTFDLGEEPGDAKDLKLQCSPDACNLSHGKKPVHMNDRSFKLRKGGSNPSNHQRSKHSQALSKEASRDERAVVPDRRRLGRSRSPPYVMVFLCLLFVAYIWTTVKW